MIVILSDPSTFGVMDIHEYFQEFTKFIESNMANVLPDSTSLEEEALTLERRGHTSCLSLLSFGFDLCLMMCCAIDLWTDSVTRRPYAIDPALLDVDA
jgi:hypothetical protein